MSRPRPHWSGQLHRCLAALLLALGAAGCRTPAPRTFPIGIYAPGEAENLPLLRDAGFDLVLGPATRPFLDAALASGIRVLAVPGTPAGPTFDPALLRNTVLAFGRHPALWAWYLADEPDLRGVAPAEVRGVRRAVRATGSMRPTAITVWNGTALSRYPESEILMVDHYPVGLGPLAGFFKEARAGRAIADVAHRSFVPVVQAMDWSSYPIRIRALAGGDPSEAPPRRPPNVAELRCMAWGARILGADGLFFYCYDDGLWRMPEHPAVWKDLSGVVREIRDLEPLVRARQPRVRVNLQWFEPGRSLNEALESSVLLSVFDVDRGNASVVPGRYVVLVNTTMESHLLRLGRAENPVAEVPWLGTGKTARIGGGQWLDPLDPCGVMILGPLPAGLEIGTTQE